MHPNPDIQKYKYLLSNKNINIISPINHTEMIELIKKCKFLISDSGGIQEETSFLNKRIIVCRKTTERPETIGTHTIMCPSPEQLSNHVNSIYNNYMINEPCPYGDGFAWKRIKNVFTKLHI